MLRGTDGFGQPSSSEGVLFCSESYMVNGYIKLQRDLQDSRLARDPELLGAWVLILFHFNYSVTYPWFGGQRIALQPGEMVTSRQALARLTGLPEHRIRTLLKSLQQESRISLSNDRRSTRITLSDSEAYKESRPTDDRQNTKSTPTDDHTIRRRRKNNRYYLSTDSIASDSQSDESAPKPKRAIFQKPTLEEVAAYANERQWWEAASEAQKFYDYQESVGWTVGRKPMKDWRAAMRTWERTLPVHPRKVLEYFRDKMTPHEDQYFADTQAELFWKHYTATDWKTGTGQRIGKKFEAFADKWIATYRRSHQ